MISDAESDSEGGAAMTVLETMAGKGTEVGRSFEELAQILDRVELKSHMGVCLIRVMCMTRV